MSKIFLTLPMPPSINIAYFNCKHGRVKTKACTDWEEEARKDALRQDKFWIEGDDWLNVEYLFYFPIYNKDGTKKNKDAMNFEKVLSDFLAKLIVGFEDKKIIDAHIRKIDSQDQKVEISIWEDVPKDIF